ncbi:acetyl-CoA C-acetyltransferase [Rhodoblastus acidophilus]|uniref:thiolase family protein n=1 Tax=Rhodoblastus acidophilus TaxID=1074 RepID=UPI00222527BB|nr:thiolase family protein [Rhodoblastus acidophilus]MCW2286557.1 acetyl-CoA C-acetyltransferase [Rhodoblastus acidophilus]MCW2335406.1 acetyl-CoA C-acetyltransferase [Rhodoblastus acidophilus]
MSTREILLCHPARTPIGAFGGALNAFSAAELGGIAVRAVVQRSGLDPAKVGGLVMGNVVQAGGGQNPARQAGLGGGLPISVPAMTVNRVCGSGAQAIISAAQQIGVGEIDCAVAGGFESMERTPHLLQAGRWGARMGATAVHDSMLRDGLEDAFSGEHAGWHAEDLVTLCQLTREAQDRFAERSQRLFCAARDAGKFEEEIVAVDGFARDEAPRADTTLAALSKLRPAFRADGTITAGNAPGLNSGAAAMIVAEAGFSERNGLRPMARLAGYGVAAVEPGLFGLAPAPAIETAVTRAGWRLAQVERFEINEAFAAVPLAVMQKLGLPDDVVNVEGGAIAHGHPIGATGAILATRLMHAMRRDGVRRGVVSLCIGGGMGVALALEAF